MGFDWKGNYIPEEEELNWEGYDTIYGNKTGKRGGGRRKPIEDLFPNYHPGCNHWRQRVPVGRRVVTCSSYNVGKDLRSGNLPDFGVYLYSGWNKGVFTTNGCYIKALANRRPYPMLFVDWPDMGILKADELDTLVSICLTKMRHGKLLDIACNAGHGRTGTLLACLIARTEHLSGVRAIAEARSRYCRHALESTAQERAVAEYAGRWRK
jgi:protein-tyrosine phosphatase